MPLANRKSILEDLFSSVLLQLKKKKHPSGNTKLKNLGVFQSLKLRILMVKIVLISRLKLEYISTNTLFHSFVVGYVRLSCRFS